MANPAFSTAYRGQDGRLWINVTEDKTLTAAESGVVQNVIAEGVTVTLPATATVGHFIIRDGGVSATNGPEGAITKAARPKVDPNADDTIAGFNVSGANANGKYIQVAAADAQPGDEVCILNGPTDGGTVVYSRGNWAREA